MSPPSAPMSGASGSELRPAPRGGTSPAPLAAPRSSPSSGQIQATAPPSRPRGLRAVAHHDANHKSPPNHPPPATNRGIYSAPQQRADTSPARTPSSRAASLLHLQNPKGCGSGGGRAPSSLPAPKTQPGRTHLLFRVFTATEPAHGGTSSNARACLGCWQRKYFVTGAQRSGCSPAPVYSPIFGAGAEGSSTGVTQLGVNTQPSAGPAPAPVNHSCCS